MCGILVGLAGNYSYLAAQLFRMPRQQLRHAIQRVLAHALAVVARLRQQVLQEALGGITECLRYKRNRSAEPACTSLACKLLVIHAVLAFLVCTAVSGRPTR